MQKGNPLMTADVMMPLLNDPANTAMLDTALKHLFMVQFRLGFADPPAKVPWALWGEEKVNTPAHQQLAKEAADQSIVLLKNDGKTLPLSVAEFAGKDIAVMGRNANATANMQGNYFVTSKRKKSAIAFFFSELD